MAKTLGLFLVLSAMASTQLIHAQSLVGAWVSGHIILVLANFSITFDPDGTYELGCILGKAMGTYRVEEEKIIFTPQKSDITDAKANDLGSVNIYAYQFADENTLSLSSGWVNVTLTRKEAHEGNGNPE
ncbi:MAG: hypothetical protein ACLQCB_03820 [Spirochaetia bacterium]